MKTRFMLLLLACGFVCGAQSEFKVHENGLIYSTTAVSKLRHIVDSLNLKFKKCDLSKKFVSIGQSRANFIRVENKLAGQAKKDIDAGIPYADFKKKYPKAAYDETIIVTKDHSDWDGRPLYWISSLEFGKGRGHHLNSDEVKSIEPFRNPVKGKWIVYHHERIGDWPKAVEAFYFPEEFTTKPIPAKYAEKIQYADCLIDSTAQVFADDAKEHRRFGENAKRSKAMQFSNYVYDKIKKPGLKRMDYASYFNDSTAIYGEPAEYDGNETDTAVLVIARTPKEIRKLNRQAKRESRAEARKTEKEMKAEMKQFEADMEAFDNMMARRESDPEFIAYQKKRQEYEDTRLSRIDSLKNADLTFMPQLKDAFDEVVVSGGSFDDFEELVGRYLSKDAELQLKRNRRVIGGCSMDQSPRYHAFNIALLSAETTKWEIFLRSHLNIMNDRFDRVSDGSYAQGERETYIKELEALDINVPDLIFGISLRVDNAPPNHYYSSIDRTGRALSESKDAKLFENEMLNMIADAELDDFNRGLIYFLFVNYNYHIKDKSVQAANVIKLKAAVAKMPDYIASRITFER